ncbi:hypothetical protein FNV43_RR04295 [Rhamnella rubrinervis]|uniref:Uncharacterized protein n=1 Tax=Rhamnella rubrinervis TaxID=2594499 RepID=A0A8K0HLL2_9ROSA|nr:hypothetical protein FNV43_RR04295 [Rhamnella rubrinervis]
MKNCVFTKEIHDCKDEEHDCRDESCVKKIHDLQRSERWRFAEMRSCGFAEMRSTITEMRAVGKKCMIAEMRSYEKEIHDLQRSERVEIWRDEELWVCRS